MTLAGKVSAVIIRAILYIICKIDASELKTIPRKGPYIVAMNHINFLEVPMIFTLLLPRKVHGIAKKETWDNKFIGWLATQWKSISVDRENISIGTFRKAKEYLARDRILIIAPEGTRSHDGKLAKAHPGIISMAVKSDVPIYPVVHFGGEKFWEYFRKLKRTPVTFKVGKPLRIKAGLKLNQKKRQEIIDQVMYQLAALLPEEYRGYYHDLSLMDFQYLETYKI